MNYSYDHILKEAHSIFDQDASESIFPPPKLSLCLRLMVFRSPDLIFYSGISDEYTTSQNLST